MTSSDRPFLNTRQASFYLGLSVSSLERMRKMDEGPIYRRHGCVIVYHLDDLNTWSEENSSARMHAHG
jgi:hypothetical protein